MENKKLDFSAPLMSARRYSSPNRQHSLPVCKSDCELGEVTKPAAVPFLWEQIPGKAKGENKSRPQRIHKEIPNIPRLPPNKLSGVLKNVSGEKSGNQSIFRPQTEASSLNDHARLLEILKEGINSKEDSGVESGSDAYSDALSLVSPTESFSFNCSVSGLSGYDGPNAKESGIFCTDEQTLDFMMSRFLPAAKAMVLETPQYVSKKQPTVIQRPTIEFKAMVVRERKPLNENDRSPIMSQHLPSIENSESETEDDEYVDVLQKSARSCGLLPRLCVKNSLCLLNPVPGVKLKTQAPIPLKSTAELKRRARTFQSGPLDERGCEKLDKKKSHSGILSRHLPDARNNNFDKKKSYSGILSRDFPEAGSNNFDKKKSYSGILSRDLPEAGNRAPLGHSNQLSYSGDLCARAGVSPFRQSRAGGISPYRNPAPQSPIRNGTTFLGLPKEVENVRPINSSASNKLYKSNPSASADHIYKQKDGSVSPAIEKTLYVDSVKIVKTPIPDSVSSEAEGHIKSSSYKTTRNVIECPETKEISPATSLNQESRILHFVNGGNTLTPKSLELPKVNVPCSPCASHLSCKDDRINGQGLEPDSGLLEGTKVNPSGSLDVSNEVTGKLGDEGKLTSVSLPSPLPPPLPKSPSESWLWRTLPSIPLRNPFSHTNHRNQKQSPKAATTHTKWETIVKTSKVHQDHVRYSQELVPHASQHS